MNEGPQYSATHGPQLDVNTVRRAYSAWAPVYDYSFGFIASPGRKLAVSSLNRLPGRILEIGVGTGLSLPQYRAGLEVVGIDLSAPMLERAAVRVKARRLAHKRLALMDASKLGFADRSFDAVAAMYVMTVVPDPAAVMAEMARVLKPGGAAIVVNHFSREGGLRGAAERWLARFSDRIGWHPVFPVSNVLDVPGFALRERIELPPAGLFTLLRLERTA